MNGPVLGTRMLTLFLLLALATACWTGQGNIPARDGIPDVDLPGLPTAAAGEAVPTPVTALNVLAGDAPDATPTPTVVRPELTPDIVLESAPARRAEPTPELTVMPTLDPVAAACVTEEVRILELGPLDLHLDALREICRRAPISEADYGLAQTFADCMDEYALAWTILKPELLTAFSDGLSPPEGGPQESRAFLLGAMGDAGVRSRLVQINSMLCNPGPEAQRLRLAAEWTVCMEGNPAVFAEFRTDLADDLALGDKEREAVAAASPGRVSGALLLFEETLPFDLSDCRER